MKAKVQLIFLGVGAVLVVSSLWFDSPPATRLDAPMFLSVPSETPFPATWPNILELISPPPHGLQKGSPPQTRPDVPHLICPPVNLPVPDDRIRIHPMHSPPRPPGYILPELAACGGRA